MNISFVPGERLHDINSSQNMFGKKVQSLKNVSAANPLILLVQHKGTMLSE